MDTRNGRIYNSVEEAEADGVPARYLRAGTRAELRAILLNATAANHAKVAARKKSARKATARSRRQNRSTK